MLWSWFIWRLLYNPFIHQVKCSFESTCVKRAKIVPLKSVYTEWNYTKSLVANLTVQDVPEHEHEFSTKILSFTDGDVRDTTQRDYEMRYLWRRPAVIKLTQNDKHGTQSINIGVGPTAEKFESTYQLSAGNREKLKRNAFTHVKKYGSMPVKDRNSESNWFAGVQFSLQNLTNRATWQFLSVDMLPTKKEYNPLRDTRVATIYQPVIWPQRTLLQTQTLPRPGWTRLSGEQTSLK